MSKLIAAMAGQRRRLPRRPQGAQATVEISLVIPILLLLLCNFLAVMMEVKYQNQLQAAVGLAAQSALAAPVDDFRSCAYLERSFFSTAYATTAPTLPSCGNAVPPITAPGTGHGPAAGYYLWSAPPIVPRSIMQVTSFGCDGRAVGYGTSNYLNGVNYAPGGRPLTTGPPVTCTATAKFSFKQSPLGFGIFYTPTITVKAQAVPTWVRQCSPGLPPAGAPARTC